MIDSDSLGSDKIYFFNICISIDGSDKSSWRTGISTLKADSPFLEKPRIKFLARVGTLEAL